MCVQLLVAVYPFSLFDLRHSSLPSFCTMCVQLLVAVYPLFPLIEASPSVVTSGRAPFTSLATQSVGAVFAAGTAMILTPCPYATITVVFAAGTAMILTPCPYATITVVFAAGTAWTCSWRGTGTTTSRCTRRTVIQTNYNFAPHFQIGAKSGFEMCFCYRIPARCVLGVQKHVSNSA